MLIAVGEGVAHDMFWTLIGFPHSGVLYFFSTHLVARGPARRRALRAVRAPSGSALSGLAAPWAPCSLRLGT